MALGFAVYTLRDPSPMKFCFALTLCAVGSIQATTHEGLLPVHRFYDLDGELDRTAWGAALGELGLEAVRGPISAGSQPGHTFVALRCPADLAEKTLRKRLKRTGVKVQPLAWMAFDDCTGNEGQLPNFGTDFAGRDHVLGMSGHILWYDRVGDRTQFFVLPGKIKPKDIAKRYEKLFEPFGGGTLGPVARDTITWELAQPLEPKFGRKLQRAIAKLDGVEEVQLDAASGRLEVIASLAELSVSGEAGTSSGVGPPRWTWSTNDLFELLHAEGAVPAPASKPEGH